MGEARETGWWWWLLLLLLIEYRPRTHSREALRKEPSAAGENIKRSVTRKKRCTLSGARKVVVLGFVFFWFWICMAFGCGIKIRVRVRSSIAI